MTKGENYNHPAAGRCTTAEPIRSLDHIRAIRQLLAGKPRDLCLFEMGIHTNLRIGDLLALTVGQVAGLPVGGVLPLRQQKRGKFGLRTINARVHGVMRDWLNVHPSRPNDTPNIGERWTATAMLFCGKCAHDALTVPYASRLVKQWCVSVGLPKRGYSAHSLRKTFGYHAVNTHHFPVHVVSAAFGHRDIATTLLYLGIQDEDVNQLFMAEI